MARRKQDPTARAQEVYNAKIEPIFNSLLKIRRDTGVEVAMLCYQEYACVHFDYLPQWRRLREASAPEAIVMRAIADMLMRMSGRDALTDQEIETFFHG